MPAKQAEILTEPTKRHSGPISQGKRSLTQFCWMTLTGALVAFRHRRALRRCGPAFRARALPDQG
jgi:hypothetical protein